MPMLGGLLKRARNSGEIAGIITNVVHSEDEFLQRPDDFDRPIEHRPPKLGTPRGKIIGAYALAKLKDGTILHEVMDLDEIEKVRESSKSKDGPAWTIWYGPMARKSAFKRLSKYMPMDSEVDDLIRRDDEAEGLTGDASTIEGRAEVAPARIESRASKLDALEALTDDWNGATEDGEVITADGEVIDDAASIIGDFSQLETLNDILAQESNAAIRAQAAKLSKPDQERVRAAIERMKQEKRAAA